MPWQLCVHGRRCLKVCARAEHSLSPINAALAQSTVMALHTIACCYQSNSLLLSVQLSGPCVSKGAAAFTLTQLTPRATGCGAACGGCLARRRRHHASFHRRLKQL